MYKRLSIIGSMLRARAPSYQADLMRLFSEDVLPAIRSASAPESEGGLRVYVHEVRRTNTPSYPFTDSGSFI